MTQGTAVPADRDSALARLQEFLPSAGEDYARRRNFDLGADQRDHVSCLSPYIRRRIVTEAEVVREVLQVHSLARAEKFVQEIFWRTYWKGWLEMRPAVWRDYLSDLEEAGGALGNDRRLEGRFTQAISGATGIDCFDSWAEELVATGYLHNHARMWFASIWIYTLRLPWVLGADFFYRHLLDADPASNTLSWRWVGGLHTKGKHYLARADNIRKFTDGRFDPKGQLDERAEPLIDDRSYSPESLATGAPEKIPASGARTGLLLTCDDLLGDIEDSFEELFPGGISSLAILSTPALAGSLPGHGRGDIAQEFSRRAIEDAAQRLGRFFDLEVVTGLAPSDSNEWAASHELDRVVAVDSGVGETRQQLRSVRSQLQPEVCFQTQHRPWDVDLYPFAKAGFFKFKRHIPDFLARHSLA